MLEHILRPAGRVIAPFIGVCLTGHGGEHIAPLGVCLVLALCVQIKENARISVEDRFNANALLLVVLVFLVFIDCTQAPCTESATDSFLECVIVCFIGARIQLIGAIKPVASICQLVIF